MNDTKEPTIALAISTKTLNSSSIITIYFESVLHFPSGIKKDAFASFF
ncbi:hypothetical protein [Paraglaciecola sp. MB-3u-78]|nr:hypothetical protein [Paraglaciecola sp. MB-3u-78]